MTRFSSTNLVSQKGVAHYIQRCKRKKKNKPAKPRIFYSAKSSLRNEDRKSFPDMQKLREFITAKLTL